ncbi:trigger factor [Corynebacterium caspium]|uniref:trigger factor n=1 Tax=Corynebacterium caspium TaxID=234828 RepID=UPI00035CBD02|nr:trigger factor [Corynebacterium caspium]WKD58829.1 Trigger factor [Corynebacterium caspium DSM 44850]
MKSSVEKLSDTRVKLTINVPFDELKGEFDRAYADIAQQVSIPGFRRGKAPRKLIDARFGRGPILEQVVNEMVPSKYEVALLENDIKALGQPDIEITSIEDSKEVAFTAAVDIRPEITIPDFSTFEVEVPALELDEAAVDAAIDDLRARFAELKDTDRALEAGDVAILDLNVTINGKSAADSDAKGLSYSVGSEDLIPGLDAAIIGLKSGESTEFNSVAEAGEQAGEEATIAVTVQQTKERVLPELDEEFVQMASEFDTVEELRESTKAQVEEGAKSRQAAAIRDEVLKLALDSSKFELPENVVNEQVHAQQHQLLGNIAHDEAAFNAMLEAQGTTREEFDAEQRKSAENAVRTQLFLDTLAEQEKPEVSQQELTDHILFTAQSYGMDPNQFIQQLSQSGQIANLFADVRRGKALATAICRVSVTDDAGNKVDPAEYFGEEEIEVAPATEEENTEA